MLNLKLVENQPRWRVASVHYFAKLAGVLIHVEGIPFGSRRSYRRTKAGEGMATAQPAAQGVQGQIVAKE
jgi:hypothetical protein